ncbi:MAG TPA: hypothetical protein VJ924_03145 [Alphaproteobacteria bacterium]|nr:hypothetical protein [Alphaproteobacteria bacterium]
MTPAETEEIDKRLSVHEAICAERYAALLQRLSRIEWIMLSVAGALIAALAAALWKAAPVIARLGA